MPWKKGESGNPGGRPPGEKEFRQRCRDFMDTEGWRHLARIARSKDRDQFYALKFIAEMGFGKAKETLDVGSERELRIVVSKP